MRFQVGREGSGRGSGEGGHKREVSRERTGNEGDEQQAPGIQKRKGRTDRTREDDNEGKKTWKELKYTTGSPPQVAGKGGSTTVEMIGMRQEEGHCMAAQQRWIYKTQNETKEGGNLLGQEAQQ